jgi:hypothetical protein
VLKVTIGPVALACVVLSGCGGGGGDGTAEKTFDGDGYTFTYPGGWEERDVSAAGGEGGRVIALGPPEGADILAVGASLLDISVTDENLAEYSRDLVSETDEVFREAGGGVTTSAERTTLAGLPALRFDATATNLDGIETRSHVTLVYDGNIEYFMNCQFTLEHAVEMKRGCDLVERSFQLG